MLFQFPSEKALNEKKSIKITKEMLAEKNYRPVSILLNTLKNKENVGEDMQSVQIEFENFLFFDKPLFGKLQNPEIEEYASDLIRKYSGIAWYCTPTTLVTLTGLFALHLYRNSLDDSPSKRICINAAASMVEMNLLDFCIEYSLDPIKDLKSFLISAMQLADNPQNFNFDSFDL